MTLTHNPVDHALQAKAAELCWHPLARGLDLNESISALTRYAHQTLDHDLDREQAAELIERETLARRYRTANDPDPLGRSIAQQLLNAEADMRGWLAHQIAEAEEEGNLIRSMTLRQVRDQLGLLGLTSKN